MAASLSRARILMRRLHLWLGLGFGLIFSVIGLTGSALVFYTAIDARLHPAIQVARGAPDLDHALATGRARWNDPAGKWTFELTNENGAIPARYYPVAAGHGIHRMVWFSPDGSRILRAEPWGGYLMSWVYELHMQLLAGEIGVQVVGWSGVAMLVLLLTGIIAWWPRRSWAKALAFKRDAVPIRRLYDLHKLAGVLGMAFLCVLVATGVLLALPGVVTTIFAPAKVEAPQPVGHGGQLSITRALAAARGALPDGRVVFIDMPDAHDVPIRVRFQVPGDPHDRFPGSYVFVDPGSGRVLAVHDIRRFGTGTKIAGWIRTLHDGTVGGLATRLLAVLLGFVPAILFATGTTHWLLRRRARLRRSIK